jgi:hypothetical protein
MRKKTRLTGYIETDDYYQLKALLALKGKSITRWLTEKVAEELAKSEEEKHN